MIVLDASEQRVNTKMPDVPGAVTSTVLEALTGADVMVSPEKYPVKSEMLIRRHINSGAILVQRKSGRDLVSSLGDRLNGSLAKMFEIDTPFSGQRVLLTTGIFMQGPDGSCLVGEVLSPNSIKPYINWTDTGRSYKGVRTAMQEWNIRGGVSTYSLPWNGEITEWLLSLEKNLISAKESGVKEILKTHDFPDDPPREDDILQLPRRVDDFRKVLITHENLGAKGANILWEYTHQSPIGCIEILTGSTIPQVKGIGKKTVERNRELWGLEPGMKIGVFYPGDLVSTDPEELEKALEENE